MITAANAWVGRWVLPRIADAYDLSLVRARSLLRASTFLFFFVAGVTATKSASNALFLVRRDPQDLPYLYMATAVAITAVTFFVGARLARAAAKPVLRAAVGLSALVLFGLSALAAFDLGPALATLYVAGEVYATAINILFWARLGEIFDVRTAKRVFGAISAAGMAGCVLGGVAVKVVSHLLPSLVWCFFAAGTLLLIRPLLGKEQAGGQIQRRKLSFRQGLSYAASDRFPRGLALLVLLLAVQTAAVDYVFRTGAIASEGFNEGALAGLFGVLNAAVGVLAIIFQVLVTGPLMRRLGVFVFLSLVPAMTVFTGTWSMLVPAAFLPLFLLKTVEMMGSLSLYQPGLQLLYNPMPTAVRDSVRALVDGALKKLGGAVGGVLLLFFGTNLEPRILLALVLALAAAALLWVRWMRGAYLVALEAKLGRKAGREVAAIDPSDKATRGKLLETLQDPDPARVLTALSVLVRDKKIDLGPAFAALIAHPEEEVRRRVVRLIREAPDPAYGPLLLKILEDNQKRPKAEVARALELVDPAMARRALLPVLRAPLNHHDVGLVAAAITAHLHGPQGAAERAQAEQLLGELLARGRSADPQERRELARLLGALGPGPYAPRLLLYLDDPEPEIRLAAVKAAGHTRDPALTPKLITRLLDRTARRAAMEALAQYGDTVVRLLGDMLDDRRQFLALRLHVPRVLRMIGTEAAGKVMLFSNVHDDAFLRHVIIQELARLRRARPALQFDEERVHAAALRRFKAYAYYRPMAQDLVAGGKSFGLLRRAVEDRVVQNLQAALRILSLRYDQPALEHASAGFMAGNHADALELVDVALQGSDIRPQVLRFLESDNPSALPERAKERARVLVEGRDIQLAMIAWETLTRLGEDPPEVHEPSLGEPLMPKSIVEKIFILEGVQLFHGLSVDDLAQVAALTTDGHADPGQVIYRQGDPGNSMYVIFSGEVRLLKDGKPLMDLNAGDSFGQVSILDGGPRPVSAQAGDEGVDYLYLEREPFLDLITDRPEVTSGLFAVLARRLRELVDLTGQVPVAQKATPTEASPSVRSAPATGNVATPNPRA